MTDQKELDMPNTPPIEKTGSFPCVVIASNLRDTKMYPMTDHEITWLENNAVKQANGKPWKTAVRYQQAPTKTFLIAAST